MPEKTLGGVTVILPTLNEEQGLPIVLAELKQAGVTKIVVLDGGSTDGTLAIAAKQAAVQVVRQEGRGKGMAFQTFLKRAQIRDNEKYVMLDADASYDGSEVGKLAAALDSCDVVCGTRKILVHNPRSLVHVIGGQLISAFGSLLFLSWNPDITSGYWGFRGSALKKMRITAQGFDLEANLFAQAAKKGLKACCVPINYRKRLGEAKLSFLEALRILPRLLAERFSS